MKISLSWLKDYVAWDGGVEALVELLTRSGLEIASVETRGADFPNVVVAEILESNPHPNADRLSVCRVDDGSGHPRQIVCGAKNYKAGDKVPLALPGAVLAGNFTIKVGKLRGVESEGMLCSAKELRLAEDSEGLLILPPAATPGAAIASLFPPDVVLDLEVTPNRPDWLSHVGVARELAVFTGAALTVPAVNEAALSTDAALARIEDREACPFYSLRRISGVKVGPSPAWLRTRIEAIGLRPINNVVDVTNFVMFEFGQPLHAFDAAKLEGGIVVRSAAEGENFLALDGREYALDASHLVIADSKRAVAIAGVMGGEDSGVSESTVDVLLESAWFDAPRVRRTARALGLQSDSSHRFERGIDPAGVLRASARAAELIAGIAGGVAGESVVTDGSLPAAAWTVDLRYDRCRALLGSAIANAEIDTALRSIGLARAAGDDPVSTWTVPSFRGDLLREVDLIEEVIRVIGIDRIAGTISGAPAPSTRADSDYDDAMNLRRLLRGLGFHEARTSTLVPRPASAARAVLAVRNPLGEDQSALRPSMIEGLLASLRRNLNGGATEVRLFEIGRVFAGGNEEEIPSLALVMTGPKTPRNWRDSDSAMADIFDLKGMVEVLVRGIAFAPGNDPRFGMAIELRADGRAAGVLGQLSPRAARDLDARGPVVAAEIRLDAIQAAARARRPFVPIPKFPAVTRDVAAIVPSAQAWESIRAAIAGANEALLESADLFDVFTDPSGAQIPADRKSLAFSLTFRSPERTLTADEINAACGRLKDRLRTSLPIEFRE